MPIYEYGCDAGHLFEVTQKMSDRPLTTCQVCDRPVSKLISASGIAFKGAGWYVTDYSNKMKPSSGEGTPAAPSESKKDGAEKPAAAPSTAPAPPSASGSTGSIPTPTSTTASRS